MTPLDGRVSAQRFSATMLPGLVVVMRTAAADIAASLVAAAGTGL